MEKFEVKTLQTYTVRSGDTIWKIAQAHRVGLRELLLANPQINNPDRISVGQKINIPQQAPHRGMEEEIVRLVNVERARHNLRPLTENWEVSRVARFKSQDMINNNYFAHNSPVFGTPFEMLRNFGIRFTSAAENIAFGQPTAAAVMNAWMNSPGHRANILNPNFTQMGAGVARRGATGPFFYTQMFIRP